MAYDGGYAPQAQQRPYNGPVMPRAPPQRPYRQDTGGPGPGPGPGPGGDPYGGPYQNDYGTAGYYEGSGYGGGGGGGGGQGYAASDYGGGYNDGYGQGYGGGPQGYGPDPGAGPGRGGRPPMPGGRTGVPPPRQMTMDGSGGGRGGPYPPRGGGGPGPNPGPGGPMRGPYQNGAAGPPRRPGPPERANTSDLSMGRGRGAMPPQSPVGGGFSDNPFPPFPGQQGKPNRYDDQVIMDSMAGLDLNAGAKGNSGQRLPPMRSSGPMGPGGPGGPGGPSGPGGPGGNYGPPPRGPPQRAYTQQDAGFQQQAPPPRGPPGRGGGGGYGGDNFGPPVRTMTMPVSMDTMGPPPPMRNDPNGAYGRYGGGGPGSGGPGGGRGMMGTQRPSSAQGARMPPPQMYGAGGGGGGYMDAPPEPRISQQSEPAPRPSSFDDFYEYYESRDSGEYTPTGASAAVAAAAAAAPSGGAPFQPPQHQGPNRYPEISRTKSQPNLRASQEAVFEMVGDAPPMPPLGNNGAGPGARARGPGPGLPSHPGSSRQSNESLQSHPAPVRPGLMANSVASQNMAGMAGNKPVPVRNYNGPVGGASVGAMVAGPGPSGPAGLSGPGGAPPQQAPPQQPGAGAGAAAAPPPEPPVTPELLERLRNATKADPQNQVTSLQLAKKLVEAMDVLVPTLADPRTRNKARERYATDAHKLLKKLAGQQNGEALFFLADCLGRGVFGQDPDNKEAFTLYQSAAKLGHAAAAYRTAVCCEIGNEDGGGTRKDPLKAMQWYKRAATLGDTPAMYKVGMILLKGLLGQARNPREAVGWLKRAAERADAENPHALHELGLLYSNAAPSDVLVRDEGYARQLFAQAAELGYKFSQFRLGCAYEYGLLGCGIDSRLSILWYSKAATQAEHQSELALSGWYLTGSEGVLAQSDTEAYLWARKAAMAGLAKAEYAMGYFTEVGIGVAANLEDAKRWYWRAAAQDFPKARERLEDLKRTGRAGPRPRERISRSKIGQDECSVM